MLRQAVTEAVAHVLGSYLYTLPNHAWQKVNPARAGHQGAADALLRRLKSLLLTLDALVLVLDVADLLEASLLDRLVPNPQAPLSSQEHTTTVAPGRCALADCSRPLPPRSGPGRPRRYCSVRCREQAHLQRKILLAANSAAQSITADLTKTRDQLLSIATRFTEQVHQLRRQLKHPDDPRPLQFAEWTRCDYAKVVAMLQDNQRVEELHQWLNSLASCMEKERNAQGRHAAHQDPVTHAPRGEASLVTDWPFSSTTSTPGTAPPRPIEAWADLVADTSCSLQSITNQFRSRQTEVKDERIQDAAQAYLEAAKAAKKRLASILGSPVGSLGSAPERSAI